MGAIDVKTHVAKRTLVLAGICGVLAPLFGCSKAEEPKPSTGSYYTGPLAQKPPNSGTPPKGAMGSGTER
jgi:hypothetical protein